MKKYLVLLWILLPLPVVVLHFGRGQEWLANDKAFAFIKQAEDAEKKEDWQQAQQFYQDAAKCVSSQNNDIKLRIELAQVRTHFRMGDALAAINGVDQLLDEQIMSTMPTDFQRESRDLAGRIHYYAAWVMRLEGASRELWMEEAELARQNFRLLAEQQSAVETVDNHTTKQQENLESAVQLQRLSLTELMARKLPKEGQAMGDQGLSEQMGARRGKRGKQPGRGEGDGPPNDKGAGMKRFEPGSGS